MRPVVEWQNWGWGSREAQSKMLFRVAILSWPLRATPPLTLLTRGGKAGAEKTYPRPLNP